MGRGLDVARDAVIDKTSLAVSPAPFLSRKGLLVMKSFACLLGSLVGLLAGDPSATDRPPVRTYTNADLKRVAPYRDQLGAASKPAVVAAKRTRRREGGRGAARDEAYWRREAQRVRERVSPLKDKAVELRRRIAERQSAPGVRPYTDAKVVAWQRRLRTLERRIDDLESRLADRARRARALPGWLR